MNIDIIPKNIILTWKDNNIPLYVLENIKKLNPDKAIKFFTDKDVVEFLDYSYGKKYVDFFYSIKHGYNRGDFFRYCYLYKHGGYYSDIDIEHILPIEKYISTNTDFFSVVSCLDIGHIFQALLYVAPQHPIIKDCIEDMFNFGPNPAITPKYVGHTTTCMYNNIKKYLNQEPKHGAYGDSKHCLQLGQEGYFNGRHVCVFDNQAIAFSRYQNYSRENGFRL